MEFNGSGLGDLVDGNSVLKDLHPVGEISLPVREPVPVNP